MLATVDIVTETAELLRSMRGVWDEVTVDELDHALQAAARALDDGADDELVLATALHDVGRSPLFGDDADPRHDVAARAWLTPRFGERVGWLAGAHVAAKRYLVATQSGYGSALSDVSATTLQHQGGAFGQGAADAEYLSHPWWPDAVRLRRYDDAAKDPTATKVTIADVLAIAERVVRKSNSDA